MAKKIQGWVGTGGTEPQWRLLVKQAFVGAAANSGDANIVDHLKDPYLGGAPIANQADETGKPTGLELESDKFWIDRGVEAELNADYKKFQAKAAADGSRALVDASKHFGSDLAFGKVALGDLQQYLINQGYDGPAIQWVVKEQAPMLDATNNYDRAQIEQYSHDPTISNKIMELNHEALVGGLTPKLHGKLLDAVARRQMTFEEATAIEDRAEGQSHWATSEARADAREGRSAALQAQGLELQRNSLIGENSKRAAEEAGYYASQVGLDVGKNEALKRDLDNAAVDAGAAYAAQHPGDINGAGTAARQAASDWVKTHRRQASKPSLQGNPRQ